MENLIRIKLDPRRGGVDPIDFIRPCFCLSAWPNDSVEIWYSEDDGESWEKAGESDYRWGYDSENRDLYVSLLFDITEITLIGFFSPEGSHAGVGYSLAKGCRVPVGWQTEGLNVARVGAGWSTGNADIPVTPCGCSIYGGSLKNVPVGYRVRQPAVRNALIGCSIAEPADSPVGAGFDIGLVTLKSIGAGVTILGLGEYPLDLLLLDPPSLGAMSAEAAHRKQKTVRLNGTTPEELD